MKKVFQILSTRMKKVFMRRAGEEVEVLGAEGGFEDEEVEVDLGWGGREVG